MSDITIKKSRGGELTVEWSGHDVGRSIPLDEVAALRRYFQAERDDQLGWWRASPEFVVQPRAGGNVIGSRSVNVLNERLGIIKSVWEVEESRSEYGIAARAFFDAHPAPKPWQSAEPGEVWLITAAGKKPEPMIATTYGTFTAELSEYSINDALITAGRRIWPPQDGDNDE